MFLKDCLSLGVYLCIILLLHKPYITYYSTHTEDGIMRCRNMSILKRLVYIKYALTIVLLRNYGNILHGSQMQSGHYTALIFNDNEVLHIYDTRCSDVTCEWQLLAQQTVYLVFFTKVGNSFTLFLQISSGCD